MIGGVCWFPPANRAVASLLSDTTLEIVLTRSELRSDENISPHTTLISLFPCLPPSFMQLVLLKPFFLFL